MAHRFLPVLLATLAVVAVASPACKKRDEAAGGKPGLKVGLVTDVGGRGDHSFNDSALRGLELWAAGKKHQGGRYVAASPEELQSSLAPDLKARTPAIEPVEITPVVLQSRAQEDYEPNLQLLADQRAGLIIGVGFMLENAIEAAARRNPDSKFLLIDSPIIDAKGQPYTLPNVRTVSFKEEEGSFLVGALAGLVSETGKVGFVGGMEIPLIKKFEAGFKAGVRTTRPDAQLLTGYTGSFDNVAAGKQVAQDLLSKGAEVLFHAAGSDGLGVIQAVKEARARGRNVFAIGVDSDQSHLAPDAVLTSMVKRVDLAVYDATRALAQGGFTAGDSTWGLREGGVTYAEVEVDFPGKAEALERLEALRTEIVEGRLKVPATDVELAGFKAQP
jgi:basic membrane protein A